MCSVAFKGELLMTNLAVVDLSAEMAPRTGSSTAKGCGIGLDGADGPI